MVLDQRWAAADSGPGQLCIVLQVLLEYNITSFSVGKNRPLTLQSDADQLWQVLRNVFAQTECIPLFCQNFGFSDSRVIIHGSVSVVSMCLFVCPSQSGTVSKRLH